jgi:hypothetical protein
LRYDEHTQERKAYFEARFNTTSLIYDLRTYSETDDGFLRVTTSCYSVSYEQILESLGTFAGFALASPQYTMDCLPSTIAWPRFDTSDPRFQAAVIHGKAQAQPVAALPFSTGILPVREFTGFVLDNRKTYPHFAARLDLERFAPFRPGGTFVEVPAFDTTQPHDDLRPGCKIEYQFEPGSIHTVREIDNKGYKLKYANNWDSIHNWFHACEGATRLESWAE